MQKECTWKITVTAYQKLSTLIGNTHSKEICGMLLGHEGGIADIIPVHNGSLSPQNTFEFDPPEMLDALRSLENTGLLWCGVYHSHPNGVLHPSPKDTQDWHYPNLLYMIVGVDAKNCLCFNTFIRNDGQWMEVDVTIEED